MKVEEKVIKSTGSLLTWGVGVVITFGTVFAIAYVANKGWNRAERNSIEKGTAI